MNALSPALMTPTMTTEAEVIRRDDAILTVLRDGMHIPARRALSCLVQPEPGDLVLLGGPATRPYVLAVLERPGTAPLRLAVGGDMEIAAEGGRLTLGAETLVMQAKVGQVAVQDLALSGQKASARFGRIALVAEAIESLATRLLTRARRSYRFIEETEQLRAQDIDHRASGHLHLRGESAALHAGVLVKVNASQIHMG
ncbi:MAG TPA: DUF3540 domain-containing protein [Roseomonas sp.]|jgi:hypothetical protein